MIRDVLVPVLKDVVLVGAGNAHLQVLKQFGMKPVPGVRLTLITRDVHPAYSGMLPELIAGYHTFDESSIDTGPLTHFAGARLYHSTVTSIDRMARRVICNNRPPVPYDILSIDLSSAPALGAVPGAAEHAIAIKPADGFLMRFDAALARMKETQSVRHIAMVGGGANGVEMLIAIAQRMRDEFNAVKRNPKELSFTLVSAANDILPAFPLKFRERVTSLLQEQDIQIATGSVVTRAERGTLYFETRPPLNADEIFWATVGRPPAWLRETGLRLDEDGFIKVQNTLLAEDCDNIFAVGDFIAPGANALPKSDADTVRCGPVLGENIRRLLLGKRPKSYRPRRRAARLISIGENSAVATRNGFVFSGRWVGRWKRSMDDRFVASFAELPQIAAEEISGVPVLNEETQRELDSDGLRCGGGGAKVSAVALGQALVQIHPLKRPEVLGGLEAGEDAAILDIGGDFLSVQSVDHFRAMIDDPYLFGKITANHALNDIYAMGANPETALAVATLPYGLESKTANDLEVLLTGANETLVDAGCALAGGHTAEGAELALGFAVTGAVARERILHKSGAQAGDLLILTKPLGTGTLLAANMRGQAKARWVMAAIAHMLQSNRTALGILMRHGVHAATDVSGFGLLGHLAEILRASQAAAVIRLDMLRVLPGATRTLEAGIVASIHSQNLRMRRVIRQAERLTHPLHPLLFDPQTAGGLLAAIPHDTATIVMKEMLAAGYRGAAIIGEVTRWDGAPELVSLRL